MQLPVLLDRSRAEALTGQLVDQLRDAIRRGMIPSGTRLPSSRRLSDQLGISRNTAVRAYDALVLEGYAETRPASGIFALKPALLQAETALEAEPPSFAVRELAPHASRPPRPAGDQHRVSFDFFPGRSNANLFPLRAWRRLLLANLSRGGTSELSRQGDPGGLFGLREALSSHLSTTRGIVAQPARILITNGAQEALTLAARAVLAAGRHGRKGEGESRVAVVEDPCYAGAAGAFEAEGAVLVGVPVDAHGLRTDRLPEGPAALLYVTPAHQYPTGRLLAAHRREPLVAWARRNRCVIVEDDYDGDIRYEGSPLPAIAAAAPDCTIHVGSFTETMGAGLRLGFMVVPASLVEHVRAEKALLSHASSWLEQAALADFIRGGGYGAHLARLRAVYRDSRDMLLGALTRHFGPVDVSGESSGLHLLWLLPPGVPEASTLRALARRARVGLYPLEAAGVVQGAGPAGGEGSMLSRRGVVLGYGALSPRQIADGIARLSDAVDDRLDLHHEFLHELLVHEPGRPAPAPPPHHPVPSPGRTLALRPAKRRRPVLGRNATGEEHPRMAVIEAIYRYPVKGLSAQPVSSIRLEAGRPLPFDRIFALARGSAKIDPVDPQWAKKGLFIMLMLEEELATVRTWLDVETMRLTVHGLDGSIRLTADLDSAEGRAEIEAFYEGLVPGLRGRPVLVRSRAGHFMDKPDNVVSLINLATLRSLEERWGTSLDPLRFRANVYVDGVRPWEEFDWIGGTLRAGEAVLRVDRRNGRCGATNVDPWTGRRDRDVPAALRAAFGHKDLGVYLVVERGGVVAAGDAVTLELPSDGVRAAPAVAPVAGASRFICRGCYYIYDEAVGVPGSGISPGTPVSALPASYRCPDCGTDAGKLRPHS